MRVGSEGRDGWWPYLGLQTVHILIFVSSVVLDDTVVAFDPTVGVTWVILGKDTPDMGVVIPLWDAIVIDEAERPHDGWASWNRSTHEHRCPSQRIKGKGAGLPMGLHTFT